APPQEGGETEGAEGAEFRILVMMPPIPSKRFYKAVRVEARDGGFAVLLDDKPVMTPAGAVLVMPTHSLALVIADEWALAGERIDLDKMKLTRLAMTAVDRGATDRALWTDEILKYAGSDLVCYRSTAPAALVERQRAAFDSILEWAGAKLGARFAVTTALQAISQPPDALDAVARRLASLDAWRLLGTRRAAELSGSAILALALEGAAFRPEDILAAARLDETFQRDRWGEDAEAAAREARIAAEFQAVARWLDLLRRR
ncbi:MAG: ATP12 family protein, partial [Parvularculaceae bacterium]